ncbi:MAG: hypothetical protein IH599_03750, partial [Bacteroidales bacterium]|nr:hypothetical protein [Bacteroidales bacterium]
DLNYAGRAGYLPVRTQGHPLRGGRASLDASISSQFASGLAMIAPLMDQGLSLELGGNPVSLPYLDLTLSMLTRLGMKAVRNGTQVRVEQGEYPDSMIHVEPDWSAAAFIYAAVALSPGAQVRIPGLSLDSAQGDKQAANVFAPLGVNTSSLDDGIMIRQQDMASEEPMEADLRDSPDLLPALAVAAAMLERKALFHGMAHLRVKESDRIDAVLSLLRQCGYQASAGPDWLSVQGNTPGHCDPVIDPRNDHRLAMAFSLLCFRNEVSISNAGCVEKSWPDFWDSLSSLGFRIKQI